MRALILLHQDLSDAGRSVLKRVLTLTTASMGISIFASVLALSTGWAGFSLGLFSGFVLLLMGYVSAINRSSFGTSLYAGFAALASIMFLA